MMDAIDVNVQSIHRKERKTMPNKNKANQIFGKGKPIESKKKMFLIETKSLKVSQALRAYKQKLNYTY